MEKENSHISVIILQYNHSEYTIDCLRSVKKWFNAYNLTYDVLVIDNGSEKEHKERLVKFYNEELPIQIIFNDSNRGFGPAMNQGMQIVKDRCDYVLLLNNDACVTRATIFSMVQCAESDEKIAVVGAKVLKPNSTFVHHSGVTYENGNITDRYIRSFKDITPKYIYEERLWVNGCCMLIKTSIIKSFGVFDDEFAPAYFEEADYCIRLRKAGYRVVYNPLAIVYHHQRITSSAINGMGDIFYRNWEKLLQRHSEYWKSNQMDRVTPRVNIIIPAYNASNTIQKTIQSIEKQTYQDYKIIVVDDGSTDNTEEIVKNYQQLYKNKFEDRNSKDFGPCYTERENGIMYIKIENSGQSHARNTALSFIEPFCDYIAYCDADDIWEPEHLEHMVMFLEKNKEYSLVCHKVKPVNEKGEQLKSFGIPSFSGAGRFNDEVFKDGNPVFISTVLHRVNVIKAVGGFVSELDCIEDWHMWWKISKTFNCYYLPLQLTQYVVRNEGFAGKTTPEKKDKLQKYINEQTIYGPKIKFQYYNNKEYITNNINEKKDETPKNEKLKSIIDLVKSLNEEDKNLLAQMFGG